MGRGNSHCEASLCHGGHFPTPFRLLSWTTCKRAVLEEPERGWETAKMAEASVVVVVSPSLPGSSLMDPLQGPLRNSLKGLEKEPSQR